jgi:hypothetical protein
MRLRRTVKLQIPFDSAEGRLSASLLMTQCRTYGARILLGFSQPFRAGLTFGGRPSGPRIHGDRYHFSLKLSQTI